MGFKIVQGFTHEAVLGAVVAEVAIRSNPASVRGGTFMLFAQPHCGISQNVPPDFNAATSQTTSSDPHCTSQTKSCAMGADLSQDGDRGRAAFSPRVGRIVKHIVVVPDRFTFIAEEELLASEGGGCLDVEVLTFNRLYNRHCKQTPFLDRSSAIMLIEHLLLKNVSALKSLRSSSPELAQLLYDTIMQFKACKIYPSNLSEATGRLRYKLEDFTLIYQQYQDYLLESGLCDASDKLTALASATGFSHCRFYFALFDSLTAQHLAVIKNLATQSDGVCVGLCHGDNPALYQDDLRTALISLCDTIGIKPDFVHAEEKNSFARTLLSRAYYDSSYCGEGARVRLLSFKTPEQEMDTAARHILAAVRSGLRYRDVSVLAGGIDQELLSESLTLYNIPHYIEGAELLHSHPLMRLITSSLDALAGGLARVHIQSISHNPRLNIGRESRERFLNYISKYAVDYSMFLRPFTADDPNQEEAERVRLCVVGAITMLKQGSASEILAAAGQMAQRFACDEDERALKEILLLIERAGVLGGAPYKYAKLNAVLSAGAKSVRLTVLPPYADMVYVGGAENFRGKRHALLLVLGARAGALPLEQVDAGLVTDRDILEIRELKQRLEPMISEVNSRNRYEFAHSLTTADEVIISYTGEKSRLLPYLETIFNIPVVSGEEHARLLKDDLTKYLSYAYPTRASLARGLARAVEAYRRGERIDDEARAVFAELADPSFITLPTQEPIDAKLFFEKDVVTSVSRLEKYFSCPYAHFLEYGAELCQNEEGGVNLADVGTVLHRVAEKYLTDGLPEPTEDYVLGAIGEDAGLFGLVAEDGGIFRRVLRDGLALCRALREAEQNTDYKFYRAETEFDNIEIADGARLRGKIDRIDCHGDFVRIVDYKTGTVSLELSDVYFGRKLQLVLYLKALTDKGYRAGGAFYYPIRPQFVDKKKPPLTGFAINEINELVAHDKTLLQLEKGKLIGARLRIDKDNCLVADGRVMKSGYYSEQQLLRLCGYAAKAAAGAVKEISEGYAQPNPTAMACTYCTAKPSCFYNGQRREQKLDVDIRTFDGEEKD